MGLSEGEQAGPGAGKPKGHHSHSKEPSFASQDPFQFIPGPLLQPQELAQTCLVPEDAGSTQVSQSLAVPPEIPGVAAELGRTHFLSLPSGRLPKNQESH